MNNIPVETALVKYVYLDIVGFTKNRSVEAQSDLVAAINTVVRGALKASSIPPETTILIPTGDGMAIALKEFGQYDLHLILALEILRLIADHNNLTEDNMRKFEVRIGVNENVDNLVLDINGKQNVAGNGISMAQRIMDKADAGQILLGSAVYETLRSREKYMRSFQKFNTTDKHGVAFQVYQYLSKSLVGLNNDTPSAFAPPTKTESLKFTKLVAYFVAHAYANREFFLSQKGDYKIDDASTVLLSFLAEDSIAKSQALSHENPSIKTWKAETVLEQYKHYYDFEYWPLVRLASYIKKSELSCFVEYFEKSSNILPAYWFPKKSALEKLCSEHPSIAAEFGISI